MVVLTVDDHPLIRSALREVLSVMAERLDLIEASNPDDGLALLGERRDVDLIFLDLHFSRHDGLAFVERFRAAAPAVPLIIYTMHEDTSALKQALAYGVAGIVPKTHSAKLLQKAIELVIEGGVYMPPDLARELACPEPPSNKEIARTLGIASSTVKNQLTVVFERLGVSNRTQAAMAARALVKNGGGAGTTGPQA